MSGSEKLKNRDLYLNKLVGFQDINIIKIVTGIRRCGKSSLLKLMVAHLIDNGIMREQIVEINFESNDFHRMSSDDIYNYVKERMPENCKMYLFFDEIQRIPSWETAINALYVDIDCDIYITGSNSYLLSSEYATYLSGRCVQIRVLPLSFSEFLYFHDFTVKKTKNVFGDFHFQIYDKNGEHYELRDVFGLYLRFGGMPGVTELGFDLEKIQLYIEGIYSTVVLRDILERGKRSGNMQISDPILLRKIIMFLADNVGSVVSAASIGNILSDEGLIDKSGRKITPSAHTVQSYINALLDSFLFYEIKRFDIKGKEYLRTLGKYYITDLSLRNYLLGFRNRDIGHILENVVYLELLRRGYDVAIGKIGSMEIDFIATNTFEKMYIQVTETMLDENVRKRELAPLQKIRDNFEKIVLSLDNGYETSYDGIKSLNLMEWLLEK